MMRVKLSASQIFRAWLDETSMSWMPLIAQRMELTACLIGALVGA